MNRRSNKNSQNYSESFQFGVQNKKLGEILQKSFELRKIDITRNAASFSFCVLYITFSPASTEKQILSAKDRYHLMLPTPSIWYDSSSYFSQSQTFAIRN